MMKIITYAGLPFQDKSIEKKIKQVLNTTTDKEWYRIPTNIIDEHVHEVTENKDCIITVSYTHLTLPTILLV